MSAEDTTYTRALPTVRVPSAWSLLVAVAVCLAVGWIALTWVAPNADWLYSLRWGDELAHGTNPDVLHPNAPLVHPLPVAIGVLLSPLNASLAFDLVSVLAVLSLALLAFGAFRLAAVLVRSARGPSAATAGIVAGSVAAFLVLSRGPVEFFAMRATVDVPFTGLVLLALADIVESPRSRPERPLILLAAAGLLRPDSWLIGIGYCAWLWREGSRPPPPGAGGLTGGCLVRGRRVSEWPPAVPDHRQPGGGRNH